MNGKNIIFNHEKIKKSNFYKNTKPSKIDEIDVDKVLVSKREPHGIKNLLKYFIGYKHLNSLIVIRQCLLKLLIISY